MSSPTKTAVLAAGVALFLASACAGSSEERATPSPSAFRPTGAASNASSAASPSDVRVIDLATQPPLLSIFGADAGDLRSDIPGIISGDFNDDGIDDILIGARFADGPDESRPDAGEAYVVFGSKQLPATVDLAEGEQDLTIYGARPSDSLGFSAETGDINGDGVADLLIGAPFAGEANTPAGNPGAVYVLFGRQDLDGDLDLASQKPDLTLRGVNSSAFFGDSLAIGDVNGDGLADILVGATFDRSPPQDGAQGAQGGAAYLFYGRRQWPESLHAVHGEYDVALFGAEDLDELGDTVVSGDINGAGFDDIIAEAGAADGPGNARPVGAEVHILFGHADLSGEFYVSKGDQDLSILGAETNDTLGFALAAGDLNADGVDDLAMTARLADGPSNRLDSAGDAYVLLGSDDLPEEIDLATALDKVLAMHAPTGGDLMGSVIIGPLTGTDRSDLILGASFGDGPSDSRQDAGEIYLLDVQKIQGFPSVESVPGSVRIYGSQKEGRIGSSLAAGDVNRDRRLELIAVAADADGPGDSQADVGIIYVLSAGG